MTMSCEIISRSSKLSSILKYTVQMVICFSLLFLVPQLDAAADQFEKSSVFGFVPGALEQYEYYNVDFVSWGSFPLGNEKESKFFCRAVRKAYSRGTLIGAKVGTKTASKRFTEYANRKFINIDDIAVRKLDGNKLTWPINSKDSSSYWFCWNNPSFRDMLKQQLTEGVLCGAAGIYIDDPRNLADSYFYGGCYCSKCLSDYEAYIANKYSREELESIGLGYPVTNIKESMNSLSKESAVFKFLKKEYFEYLNFANHRAYKDVVNHIKNSAGRTLPVSANVNPAWTYSLDLINEVDYYFCEVSMNTQGDTFDNEERLLSIKLAESLKRPIVVMGHGRDHHFIEKDIKNKNSLIRYWIAEAYSLGSYFPAPYKLWAKSDNADHYWISITDNRIRSMFRFIKTNRNLFDGYNSRSSVCLLFNYQSYKKDPKKILSLISALWRRDINFDILQANSKWSEGDINIANMSKYDTVILPDDIMLANEEQRIIDTLRAGGTKIIPINELENVRNPIVVKGGHKIKTLLRKKQIGTNSEYVLHLLNNDYDSGARDFREIFSLQIEIPKLISGPDSTLSLVYYLPESERFYQLEEQDYRIDGNRIDINIKSLKTWGILKIGHRRAENDDIQPPTIMEVEDRAQ